MVIGKRTSVGRAEGVERFVELEVRGLVGEGNRQTATKQLFVLLPMGDFVQGVAVQGDAAAGSSLACLVEVKNNRGLAFLPFVLFPHLGWFSCREADRVILTTCQERGAQPDTFRAISQQLSNKTPEEVSRFLIILGVTR